MAISPVQDPRRRWIKRHSPLVRITHWVNVACLLVLLMSGLQIFNAHPALYWGQASDFQRPVLAMDAVAGENGALRGRTRLFGAEFDSTGLLGLSAGPQGGEQVRGFPAWATLPGPQWLAMGRRWHFFFAWVLVINGLVYLAGGFLSGHLRRDLLPERRQWRTIAHAISEHLRLRFPKGEAARHYNILQKLAYLAVIFVVLPLTVAAGLAMSPHLDSVAPVLLDLLGGRQSARTIHFLGAAALVAFVLVHVIMVLLSGVWNNLRAMITGRYAIDETEDGA